MVQAREGKHFECLVPNADMTVGKVVRVAVNAERRVCVGWMDLEFLETPRLAVLLVLLQMNALVMKEKEDRREVN